MMQMTDKWDDEETLKNASYAIHVLLISGQARLISLDEQGHGQNILIDLRDGRTFKVVPKLMDYMVENGLIELDESDDTSDGI